MTTYTQIKLAVSQLVETELYTLGMMNSKKAELFNTIDGDGYQSNITIEVVSGEVVATIDYTEDGGYTETASVTIENGRGKEYIEWAMESLVNRV